MLEPAELERAPRDMDNWAPLVFRLAAPHAPSDAWNLNVGGRRLIGAQQGFGQLWKKTFRVRLPATAVSPTELIRVWKERFESFWPAGTKFYGPLTRITPGEVALLNMHPLPGPIRLSTGVLVIYADDSSFTFMNAEGHMFAGWITFSARPEDATTLAEVEVLIRTSDPAWEIVMRLFGAYRQEDLFWRGTLQRLAGAFGVSAPAVETRAVCLDPRLQWSRALNIWRNAAVWSGLYWIVSPVRWAMARVPSRRCCVQ